MIKDFILSEEVLYSISELVSIVKILERDHYAGCVGFIQYTREEILDTLLEDTNKELCAQIENSLEGQKALKKVISGSALSGGWEYSPIYEIPLIEIPLKINSTEEDYIRAIYKWRLEVVGK